MTAKGYVAKFKPSFFRGVIIASAVLLFALFIKNSALASAEVGRALQLCATMLIPSLFPLTVASEILTQTGAAAFVTKKLCAPVSRILGVSKDAAVPYFLGLFGGYTSSCKSAILLYNNGKITKADAQSIMAFSNVPSIAFLCGFAGEKVLKSPKLGLSLWVIAVISTLFLGLINQVAFKQNRGEIKAQKEVANAIAEKQKRFSKIVVDAISNGAGSMLMICATVVFFSVIVAILKFTLIRIGISNTASEVVLGTLEITRGISSLSLVESESAKLPLAAFFVGWSGLCIHFQVMALCDGVDFSFFRYFFLKALQGIICALLSLLLII